ncbi:hypothetical protein C0Q70_12175 [Pomacea canaliculata]|uniref:ABC-type glutathione-S-conjugate transporter n=1 Tax=Pomacea canaliculata TaxID=400727 RepID=A0A2T7P0T2_POMCA|nr:hypothetical protein C0Q70_12175 [Pomacea canaliculata]
MPLLSAKRKLQIATMRIKDQRLRLMTEVLGGIKVLKLYAWEPSFEKKVLEYRDRELRNLLLIAYLNSCTTFVWTLVPYLVTLASFAAYILTSELGYLDSTTAFVSLSLFNIMRQPINMLPQVIPSLIQVIHHVALFHRQSKPQKIVRTKSSFTDVIAIKDGVFRWDSEIPKPTLRNINLNIPEGKLVAVVGPVGCGKSSLLAAMLGEMEKLQGRVVVKNSVAYVPQEAWILNATARDNILFGSSMSQRQYDHVIEACALQADFNILVDGDMTEIGEKGINISGGQKQRISLARAVYSDADTYLLDDPLSAVDSHVGKHIFQHVIGNQGLLANKTRILVTHGVHWLPMTDLIVVINDGEISEMGKYEDLLAKEGDFAIFLKTYLAMENESEQEEGEDPEIADMKVRMLQRLESMMSDTHTSGDERSKEFESSLKRSFQRQRSRTVSGTHSISMKVAPEKKPVLKLVEEEQTMKGNVQLSVYREYFTAMGNIAWIFILGFFVLYQGASLAANIWLSEWTDDSTLANISMAGTKEYNDLNALYLGVYGGLGVVQAVFMLGYAIIFNISVVRASGNMHSDMLSRVLKAPMSFFDTTPVGRIVNRFSRDVDTLDMELTFTLRQTMISSGNMLTTIILISYSTPVFLAVVVPLGILYRLAQLYYIRTSRQLRRLESTTRSPVYTHFTETIQGASSVRAYGAVGRFIKESQNRVDKNLVCYYAFLVSQRWLGVRLETLGTLVTLSAALFAIIDTSLSSGLVGLSVTYAMNVTMALNMFVLASTQLETNIVSVERVKEYAETEIEADWERPEKAPPTGWPQEGKIMFKDYTTRYRPGLDLVLRGFLSHQWRSKVTLIVGIVGRTGAGKSSLTLALFRLIEAASGRIDIDGHHTGTLGLHDLRRNLTILPQDPVIFSGTLRMNLDPTDRHTDSELWNALKLAHLQDFVSSLPGQLEYQCGEGGQNLSVGQRQLMCLARSLLRKSKILVLDEATAAVDMETDDLIQQTIRSEFKDSTVLTIAHRLNTIMDYDRILVLDEGLIKETGSPQDLLQNSNGVFYGMAKAAGLV